MNCVCGATLHCSEFTQLLRVAKPPTLPFLRESAQCSTMEEHHLPNSRQEDQATDAWTLPCSNHSQVHALQGMPAESLSCEV